MDYYNKLMELAYLNQDTPYISDKKKREQEQANNEKKPESNCNITFVNDNTFISECQNLTQEQIAAQMLSTAPAGFKFSQNYTKDEVEKALGRKKKNVLAILKPFVDVFKYKTSTQSISKLALSSKSKFLVNIYKNQRNVSNLLKYAKRVGLLECISDLTSITYKKVSFQYKKNRKSYEYCWNKQIEKILLELFDYYQISGYYNIDRLSKLGYCDSQYPMVETFAENPKILRKYQDFAKHYNVHVTSNTRLPDVPDSFIFQALYERYPQLAELQQIIKADNKIRPIDEHDYCIPTISRSRNEKITRIGLRATNQYCSTKVHNVNNADIFLGKLIRKDVLRRKFEKYYEYDVKSSVPRITYLLNHGKWLSQDIDLYEAMFGSRFLSPEDRKAYKLLWMRLYFTSSAKQTVARLNHNREEVKAWNNENLGYTIIDKAISDVDNVIGRSWGSEIFLHESCIYAQVAHKLREMGIKVIQIYDGFYTDKEVSSQIFEKLVEDCAMEYYEKYIINNVHTSKKTTKSHQKTPKTSMKNIPPEESFLKSPTTPSTAPTRALGNLDDDYILQLEQLVREAVFGHREASLIVKHITGIEHSFKEAKRGFVFEDRARNITKRMLFWKKLIAKNAAAVTSDKFLLTLLDNDTKLYRSTRG